MSIRLKENLRRLIFNWPSDSNKTSFGFYLKENYFHGITKLNDQQLEVDTKCLEIISKNLYKNQYPRTVAFDYQTVSEISENSSDYSSTENQEKQPLSIKSLLYIFKNSK